MGVDYRAMLYVGQEFETGREAENFLEKFVTLSEEDQKVIDEEGIEEFLYCHEELEGDTIDCYSGYGFVLGIELSCRNPETFAERYNEAIATWKKYFGDETFNLIHTVKVY